MIERSRLALEREVRWFMYLFEDMQLIETITEDQMIAAFLKGEISSTRFGPRILELLALAKLNRNIIDTPDFSNEEETTQRRCLMGEFRGFRQNRELFRGFPKTVTWSRQTLTRRDLKKIHYVDDSYWNELSASTRLPSKAVRSIRSGRLIFHQSNDLFWSLADTLRRGHQLPDMILVGTDSTSRLVVLEGHARLTAYFLLDDGLPKALRAIVGFTQEMNSWMALPEPPRGPGSSLL